MCDYRRLGKKWLDLVCEFGIQGSAVSAVPEILGEAAVRVLGPGKDGSDPNSNTPVIPSSRRLWRWIMIP